MKKEKIIIIITFFLLLSNLVFGQSNNNFDSLICKNWKLISYEESGEKFPPAPEQKGNRMIFFNDHKVKSIETGNIQNGIWEYDPIKRILTVVDNQTKEKAIMRVEKITTKECILEYKDPEGTLLKMYMAPLTK